MSNCTLPTAHRLGLAVAYSRGRMPPGRGRTRRPLLHVGGVGGLPVPPTPPAASHATASVPTRCRWRSSASAPSRSCRTLRASRGRRTASAADQAPAVHADGDVADAGPGVEPGPQRPERSVVGEHRTPGESDCCAEELAALVEHALLDDLVCPEQDGLRDRESEGFGGIAITDLSARCRSEPP
jgi:hypothetical protein